MSTRTQIASPSSNVYLWAYCRSCKRKVVLETDANLPTEDGEYDLALRFTPRDDHVLYYVGREIRVDETRCPYLKPAKKRKRR